MDTTEIRSTLIEVGLGDVADRLAALARPAVRASATPIRWRFEQPTAGTSRLGGKPDLPPEIAWPGDLPFIAQINLLQTVGYDTEHLLPQQGLLYFFYNAWQLAWGLDPADKGHWAVLYYDGDFSRLAPRPPKNGLPAYAPCLLDFSYELTMPPAGFKEVVDLGIEEARYWKFREHLFGPTIPYGCHRLQGYPTTIQFGDMRMWCQLAFHGIKPSGSALSDATHQVLAASVDDWLLLFQVDTDDNAGMMWGDAGMLYFWIRRQDLKRRRFDRVWIILEEH